MDFSSTRNRIQEITGLFDWDHLTDAYGYCYWIPEMMNGLAHHFAHARKQVREQIYELLFHQQTHYQATGQMVATLIRLTTIADLPEREKLIGLAAEILNAVSDSRLSFQLPIAISNWSTMARYGFSFECSWKCVASVASELFELVNDNDRIIAYWAARILHKGSKIRFVFDANVAEMNSPFNLSEEQQTVIHRALENPQALPEADSWSADEAYAETPPEDPSAIEEMCTRLRSDWNSRIGSDDVDDLASLSSALSNAGIDATFIQKLDERTAREIQNLVSVLNCYHSWRDNHDLVDALLEWKDRPQQTTDNAWPWKLLFEIYPMVQVRQQVVAEWLFTVATSSADNSTRRSAAMGLVDMNFQTKNWFGYLIELLKSDNFAILEGILESTRPNDMQSWPKKDRQLIMNAIVKLVDSRDYRVQAAAISMLGYSLDEDPDVRRRVLACYKDPHPAVRLSVANTHFDSGTDEVLRVLVQLLSDQDPSVREVALQRIQFWNPDPDWYLKSLIAAVGDPDLRVALQACESLGGKGLLPFDFPWTNEAIAETILNSIDDSDSSLAVFFKAVAIVNRDRSLRDVAVAIVNGRIGELPFWLTNTVRKWVAN